MKTRKLIFRYAFIVLLLVCADVLSYFIMVQARDQATRAAYDAELCRNLSQEIVTLQTKPVIADIKEKTFEQLTQRIEDAARQEGIGADNHLASIAPEPAARVGDTVYLEKPTTIQIRDATLPQLVGLMSRLALDGSGLNIKAFRLSAPPRQDSGDLWNAEVTISYLIYAPVPARQRTAERS